MTALCSRCGHRRAVNYSRNTTYCQSCVSVPRYGAPDWSQQGDCRHYDPEWWFPPKGDNRQTLDVAIGICRECPVQDACLAYALEHNEQYGVWGGLTTNERRALRARRVS